MDRFHIEAELESVSEIVILKQNDGQRFEIPYDKLDAKDREFIDASREPVDSEDALSQEVPAEDKPEGELEDAWDDILPPDGKDGGNGNDKEQKPLYGGRSLKIPFDPLVKSLPPDFQGHDIKVLWKSLAIIASIRKDEFETSNEFRDRFRNAVKDPLFGDVYLKSPFAVKVSDAFLPKYNADTERFRIERDILHFRSSSGFVTLTCLTDYSDSYSGRDELYESYGLVFAHLPRMIFPQIVVPVPREQAKLLRWVPNRNIEALAVFHLTQPFVQIVHDGSNSVVHYNICVNRFRLFVFNSVTGDIYARIPVSKD